MVSDLWCCPFVDVLSGGIDTALGGMVVSTKLFSCFVVFLPLLMKFFDVLLQAGRDLALLLFGRENLLVDVVSQFLERHIAHRPSRLLYQNGAVLL